MDKHQRYRLKKRLEGNCPRCGKPAFPFTLCPKHRAVNNIYHAIRLGLKHGIFKKQGNKYGLTDKEDILIGYITKENDRRKLPRFGNRPMDDNFIETNLVRILKANDCPMTDEEIKEAFLKLKTEPLPTSTVNNLTNLFK